MDHRKKEAGRSPTGRRWTKGRGGRQVPSTGRRWTKGREGKQVSHREKVDQGTRDVAQKITNVPAVETRGPEFSSLAPRFSQAPCNSNAGEAEAGFPGPVDQLVQSSQQALGSEGDSADTKVEEDTPCQPLATVHTHGMWICTNI